MKKNDFLGKLRQVKSERSEEILSKTLTTLAQEDLEFVSGGLSVGGTSSGSSSGSTCDTVRVCCCRLDQVE